MKPALYYAIRNCHYCFDVVAVTSIKKNRWYGRDQYNNPANGTLVGFAGDLLIGRFSTQADAVALIDEIKRVRAAHAPTIEAAKEAMRDARIAEQRAIDAVVATAPVAK